jgi:metal-sulfur cluster biosynthetic enzyme
MGLREQIIETLRSVKDPEMREDVYSLRMIEQLDVDEAAKTVRFRFRPTSYRCPIGIQLSLRVKQALMELEELENVEIEVVGFALADQANQYLQSLDKT